MMYQLIKCQMKRKTVQYTTNSIFKKQLSRESESKWPIESNQNFFHSYLQSDSVERGIPLPPIIESNAENGDDGKTKSVKADIHSEPDQKIKQKNWAKSQFPPVCEEEAPFSLDN